LSFSCGYPLVVSLTQLDTFDKGFIPSGRGSHDREEARDAPRAPPAQFSRSKRLRLDLLAPTMIATSIASVTIKQRLQAILHFSISDIFQSVEQPPSEKSKWHRFGLAWLY
jgi:hypothetical protein